MITTGYGICVVFSVLLTLVMALRNYEHIDRYDWSISFLLPLLIISYWLKSLVSSAEADLILFSQIELLACFLLVCLLFSMLHSLGIRTRLWIRLVMYGLVMMLLFPLWQLVSSESGITFVLLYYPYLPAAVLLAACIVLLAVSPKKRYSLRSIAGYLFFIIAWIVLYTFENVLDIGFTVLPFLYLAGQFILVITYDQVHSRDISNLITGSQKSHAARGYVAISLNGRFLNANEKSYDFFPELRNLKTESRFPENSRIGKRFAGIIENFTENRIGTGTFPSGDKTLAYRISGFSVREGGAVRGYLIDIRDATEEIRNMELLTDYNNQLNRSVAEKAQNIKAIQEKLVLSMADMVENRDGNTGGHVRRTSDVVRILIRNILQENLFPLDESLARDIIRTAPMHDLGKVSIDSGILNKPGRLTPEEYTIMKTHSTLSGQMVKILLEGVEEESLVQTAFHIARHHHERWDGKGYPDGLVGETIPLEARIMAVADVYDALVSKRVYKEPMSFEQAARIMCEGMGTQFDPNMRTVFLYSRGELEDYYSALR